MLRRALAILIAVMVICLPGVYPALVKAACTPDPGAVTSTNDSVTCNGDDVDGVNVGSGHDKVQIVSGTVLDTIISEGGTLLVIVDGGTLDTLLAGTDAVRMDGSGDVTLRGDANARAYGIFLNGKGNIDST